LLEKRRHVYIDGRSIELYQLYTPVEFH